VTAPAWRVVRQAVYNYITLHYMERVLTDQRHDGWFAGLAGVYSALVVLQRLQRLQRAPTTGRHGCCYAQATRRLRAGYAGTRQ
jgi:hypothetical protein